MNKQKNWAFCEQMAAATVELGTQEALSCMARYMITMPNGLESSESVWLIFVGIIWFVCIVTMLWVALTTLMQAIKLKKQ